MLIFAFPVGGSGRGCRYGELFKEDNEELIMGLFKGKSKERIMEISRGEREQRILGTKLCLLRAMACLNSRGV